MSISRNRLFNFFFYPGSKAFLVGIFICLIVSSILGAVTPLKIAQLSKFYETESLYYRTIYYLAFIFGGVYINRVIYQLFINKYIQLLMNHTRGTCYEHWLHSYEIKSGHKHVEDVYTQGEVISRIMNDTESLRELMTSGTFGIFIDVFFVISCLVSFISLNTVSGLFLGASEVVAALFLIWGSKYMRDIFLKVRESRAQMSRLLSNMVGGIKETFYTNHHQYASKRGNVVFIDFLNKQLVANIWDAGYYSLAESLYPILLIFVVLIFPYSNITEAAIIFAIVDLIQRSIGPVKDIAAKIANLQRAHSGLFRINEFIDDLSGDLSSRDQVVGLSLELDNMSIDINEFEYPRSKDQESETSFALKDIHLTAKPGQLIGIVGLSGCGKSTLLNILAANIFPTKGGITLTGKKEKAVFPGTKPYDIIHYREQVGIISQDSHIFSDTVAFNISMNRDIEEGLKIFWREMTESIPYMKEWGLKLETKLDQKTLSLGQKQLLAAIRSCYLKKPIVLFDEISSGLDGDLELALRNMVLFIQKKSLTFIVAHRLETIIKADKILVMESGRIIDADTHNVLIERSAVYKEFIAELS